MNTTQLCLDVPNISLGQLFYNFLQENKQNTKTALVEPISSKTISYEEILSKSINLAKALRANNYGINSVFTICSENNLNFAIPVFSAFFLGAIISPINPTYKKHELMHFLNITKSSVVFCSVLTYKTILLLKDEIDFVKEIIVIDAETEIDGVKTMQNYISDQLAKNELCNEFELAEIEDTTKQIAFVLSSSGTTGFPKGVMLTHYNFLTVYYNNIHPNFSLHFTENALANLPLFHVYGLCYFLINFLRKETLIIFKEFEPNLFLSVICKYQVKTLILVPTLLIFLAKNPIVNNYDLNHVIDIICGTAPLDKEAEQMLKQRMKNVKIQQCYGLTETTLNTFSVPVVNDCRKNGSVGVVAPNVQARVQDIDTGKVLGANQRGELCIKGPLVMLGYWDDEKATNKAFTTDGWFKTGDIAFYDEDRYFFIVDRIKELIKYNGFQIAPAELEGLLLQHKEIADAAVVGRKQDGVGEVPVAFVQKILNTKLTEIDVKKYVEENVSSYKHLRGGVFFVDAIPRSASGKILRKEVRKWLNDY